MCRLPLFFMFFSALNSCYRCIVVSFEVSFFFVFTSFQLSHLNLYDSFHIVSHNSTPQLSQPNTATKHLNHYTFACPINSLNSLNYFPLLRLTPAHRPVQSIPTLPPPPVVTFHLLNPYPSPSLSPPASPPCPAFPPDPMFPLFPPLGLNPSLPVLHSLQFL